MFQISSDRERDAATNFAAFYTTIIDSSWKNSNICAMFL